MKSSAETATETTIDASGRLVIPKEVRRASGFKPGVPLRVAGRNGHIEIEPAPVEVRLEQRGRLLVASPVEDLPPLAADVVARTRDSVNEEQR